MNNIAQTQLMKTSVLFLAILTALTAQAAENEPKTTVPAAGSPSSAPPLAYPGMPWLDYSKLPWLKDYAKAREAGTNALPAGLEPLLANLKEDLESTVSRLAALNDQNVQEYSTPDVTVDAMGVPLPTADFSTLASRDLSTLASQDLSANYGQLASTSLAVPTSVPWSTWGNRPGSVMVATPGGTMVLPVFPPRTAWGNGPGVVVTTPGGAVVSMMPTLPQPVDLQSVNDLRRQFALVQNDLEQILAYLENIKTSRTPPTYQQPYITPTGRQK